MTNDEKNRRIHELMGRHWHEPDPAAPLQTTIIGGVKVPVRRYGYVCRCGKDLGLLGAGGNSDYFTDITAAREALASAVDSVGAKKVGLILWEIFQIEDEDSQFHGRVAVKIALAPASVYAEAFLDAMEDAK